LASIVLSLAAVVEEKKFPLPLLTSLMAILAVFTPIKSFQCRVIVTLLVLNYLEILWTQLHFASANRETLSGYLQSFEPGLPEEDEAFGEIIAGYLNLGLMHRLLLDMLDFRFNEEVFEDWASGRVIPSVDVQALVLKNMLKIVG